MTTTSLRQYFRRQSLRWSLIGFGLTLLLAIPCFVYSQKLASEQRVLILAKSISRAFRPMILNNEIRDAQAQIRNALDLKPGETVLIRGLDLKPLYGIPGISSEANCKTPFEPCWSRRLDRITVLYPIFFDGERNRSPYGYVDLTVASKIDISTIIIMVLMLGGAFFVLAIGLGVALSDSAQKMINVFSVWATHLKNQPTVKMANGPTAPFTELKPMQDAVDGLYVEIEKLKADTARLATAEAQYALVREIGHDLKTPHSIVAKYFEVLLMTFDKNKSVDIAVVEKMRHSLNTIGELLRLTRASEHPDLDSCTSLGAEAKRIVGDLNNESTITSKGIKLSFTPPAAETYVGIAPVTLFRLIENLVRNAAEAINRPDGEIHVEVCDFGNHPTVTVRDNGPGIPDHLKGRIFEFAFSTKSDRGTGLGLGIVEKICRDIQARVTVESKPGEGATFTIAFLPITQHLYGETNDKAIHSHC